MFKIAKRNLNTFWVLTCVLTVIPLLTSCTPSGPSSRATLLLNMNPDSKELIYEDDFSAPKWSTTPGESMTEVYKNGEYEVTCNKANIGVWVAAPHSGLPNGVAEIDARVVAGNNKIFYGLEFRRTAGNTYYYYYIEGDTFGIDKVIQNSATSIITHTKSGYIKTDGSINHLKVAYLGNIIEVYINEQRVAGVSDNALTDGSVALAIGNKDNPLAVVAFDNFKLYRFTDTYVASLYKQTTSTTTGTQVNSTVLAQQTISPSGGTITVNKPGDPLNGLQINIPSGAYSAATNFKISERPFTSKDSRYTMATPLISIDNGGTFANQLITVKIPVKISSNDFAMGFYIEPSTGEMEGIPVVESDSSSVTLATSHFSNVGVAALHQQELEQIKTGVKSNFMPGTDDWKLRNSGTFTSFRGNCAGMSVAAIYYYDQWSSKNAKPHLYGQYLGEDANIPQQAVMAWRLISTLQKEYDNSPAIKISSTKILDRNITGDTQVYNAFAFSILITSKPQLLSVKGTDRQSGDRIGHALIVYATSNNTLLIANPNEPGVEYRLPLLNGKFGTLQSGRDNHDDPLAVWDTYAFLGRSSGLLWDKVGISWDAFFKNTVGSDLFPPAKLELVDEKGKTFQLSDSMTTDSKTVSIQVSLDALNAYQICLYRDKKWAQADDSGRPITQSKMTLNLQQGPNRIGVYVEGYTDSLSRHYQWYDFRWVTITCNAPTTQTWSGKVSGSSTAGSTISSATFSLVEMTFDFTVTVTYSGTNKGTGSITGSSTCTKFTLTAYAAQYPESRTAKITGGPVTNGNSLEFTPPSGQGPGVAYMYAKANSPFTLGTHFNDIYTSGGWGQTAPLNAYGIILKIDSQTATKMSGTWSFYSPLPSDYIQEQSPTYRFELAKQ